MSAIQFLIVVLAAVNIEASETCNKKLDFLIAVDGSATVCGGSSEPCARWYAILKFCKDIVNSLTIGPNDTRVAFITFDDTTNVEWNLEKHTDYTALLSAIDNVTYPGGEFTNILSTLKIIFQIFNPVITAGNRRGVQNIGILITDGAPENPDVAYGVASDLVQAVGTGVFVVCDEPSCRDHFAKVISSPPQKVNETYFFIDDYLNIDQVRDPLVKKFCAWKPPILGLLGLGLPL